MLALVVSACGEGNGTADTTGTSVPGNPTTSGSPSGTSGPTTTPTTPSEGDDPGSVVTIDGITYELSVETVATACQPNLFNTGLFQVVARAMGGPYPGSVLDFQLFATTDAAAAAGEELNLTFKTKATDGDLDYVLATEESLAMVSGPAFDGDLGSWTIDGRRIYGEVAVFESDHRREFTTATFDVTCPET
jgi:hypothetical protein